MYSGGVGIVDGFVVSQTTVVIPHHLNHTTNSSPYQICHLEFPSFVTRVNY